MSSIFCICPKPPSYIFTSQKSSQILRGSRCIPLSNRGQIKNIYLISIEIFNIIFLTSQFRFFQQNLIIPKSATIYHCSPTMAYGIVWAHKLVNQNRKWLDNTTDPSSAPSTPSYSYNKLNEYTDITSKKNIHCRDTF